MTNPPTIRRYDVPADGEWHLAVLVGQPIYVAAGHDKSGHSNVALYVLDIGTPEPQALYGVFTVDDPIDCPADELVHIGSATPETASFLPIFPGRVLHLFRRTVADPGAETA